MRIKFSHHVKYLIEVATSTRENTAVSYLTSSILRKHFGGILFGKESLSWNDNIDIVTIKVSYHDVSIFIEEAYTFLQAPETAFQTSKN